MESHDFYNSSYLNAGGDSLNFRQNTTGNNQHFTIDDGIIPDAFFDEFSVPYNDLPELEWFSNFGHDSFLNDDLHLIPQTTAQTDTSSPQSADEFHMSNRNYSPVFGADKSIPGKARSKRSRAAPCDWSSRIVVLPTIKSNSKTMSSKDPETPARKCTHCGSEKTPQWRSGPMGPKTLCNACGVRHKSGRLVPEYRPAASPTFVSAKHSNSHRKVMELRRQNELRQQHLFSQTSIFSESSGGDYFLRPQSHTTDFRHI